VRIIQITDLHIYPKDEIIDGVNTRNNFIKVLEDIHKINYDLVVLTGDLSITEGDEPIYKWIKQQLNNNNINNHFVIGGNHDDANTLAKVFGKNYYLTDNELYYFVKPNIIFLDTIKGYCSKKQLDWFRQQIIGIKDESPIIFMHHPPFKSGVPHMDKKYAFQQTDEFVEICGLTNNTKYVFTGHYHNEISLMYKNVSMFITPSLYLQIDMFEEDFKTYHTVPAYRIIDIDGSQLKTTVRYVFDK